MEMDLVSCFWAFFNIYIAQKLRPVIYKLWMLLVASVTHFIIFWIYKGFGRGNRYTRGSLGLEELWLELLELLACPWWFHNLIDNSRRRWKCGCHSLLWLRTLAFLQNHRRTWCHCSTFNNRRASLKFYFQLMSVFPRERLRIPYNKYWTCCWRTPCSWPQQPFVQALGRTQMLHCSICPMSVGNSHHWKHQILTTMRPNRLVHLLHLPWSQTWEDHLWSHHVTLKCYWSFFQLWLEDLVLEH